MRNRAGRKLDRKRKNRTRVIEGATGGEKVFNRKRKDTGSYVGRNGGGRRDGQEEKGH